MAATAVRDIARALEQWAPRGSAQSYDNVGLQIGDPASPVETALIALDLTAQVIDEAIEKGAALVITHHPLIFKPLRALTAGSGPGGLAFRMAQAGIALYCAHTNLDAAPGGVSFALADQLGLTEVKSLQPFPETLYKLATFVPASHLDTVREALARAGAGRIGAYEACAFSVEGTGYFRPGENANPFIGTKDGGLESVRESRLEVEVARWSLDEVVRALKASHPYEEIACDVYPVRQPNTRAGFGAIGSLPAAESLEDFLKRICERLGARAVNYVGTPAQAVQRVAVCGGSGSDLIGEASRAGADAYVTADITYHRFFEVLNEAGEPQMALIDAGHYQTEAITEKLLQTHLAEHFPGVSWLRTELRTSPTSTFVPR